MKRRGFFQSLAKAAAIVALAPQLAFRQKPIEVIVAKPGRVAYWIQTTRASACYSEEYLQALQACSLVKASISPLGASDLSGLFPDPDRPV